MCLNLKDLEISKNSRKSTLMCKENSKKSKTERTKVLTSAPSVKQGLDTSFCSARNFSQHLTFLYHSAFSLQKFSAFSASFTKFSAYTRSHLGYSGYSGIPGIQVKGNTLNSSLTFHSVLGTECAE